MTNGFNRRVRARTAGRAFQRVAPECLIGVGGMIGAGKSTLAHGLAQALGATWLRTDEIRLREFGHLRRPGQGFAQGLYAPRVSERVYGRLFRQAEMLVRAGRSVVCDGTFSKQVGRDALRRIARRHGARFHFFECVVPRAVALRRIAARVAGKTDISEARPEHYDRLKAGYEPFRSRSGRCWSRLSSRGGPEVMQRAALSILRRAWRRREPRR